MSYFLLCFFVLCFLLNPSSSQITDGNLFYAGFGATNLTLMGVAEIEKNGILRLTNDTSRLMGHAFYLNHLRFKNSTDGRALFFSTSFVFTIVPEYRKLGGYGLAFTLSPPMTFVPSPASNSASSTPPTSATLPTTFSPSSSTPFRISSSGILTTTMWGIDVNSLTSNASATASYFSDDCAKHDLNLKS